MTLLGLNEYGALLDMHQDETKSEINRLQTELNKVDEQIRDLELSKLTIKDAIKNRVHQRDLYLKMRELIGHVKK